MAEDRGRCFLVLQAQPLRVLRRTNGFIHEFGLGLADLPVLRTVPIVARVLEPFKSETLELLL